MCMGEKRIREKKKGDHGEEQKQEGRKARKKGGLTRPREFPPRLECVPPVRQSCVRDLPNLKDGSGGGRAAS